MLGIQNVFLHVTKACNLRCTYCYFSAARPLPNELSTEDYTRIWPQVVRLAPKKVVFTGGEPLLRSDILELLDGLRHADDKGSIRRCLNTNGHLVTKQLARELVGLADEVRVSLDAMGPTNDMLRGDGNFDAALRALHTFYDEGFEPKVLVTVTAASLPDLEKLLTFLVSQKFSRINVNLFRPIGRGESHPEYSVSAGDVSQVIRAFMRRNRTGVPPQLEDQKESCSNCGVGRFLNIMSNGDVFPCHVMTDAMFSLGNIRNDALDTLSNREGPLSVLTKISFKELGMQDDRIRTSLNSDPCLGNAFHETPTSPVWEKLASTLSPDDES